MFKKLSVLLLSTVVLGLFSFAGVTHAEGDTLCKGRITGVTIKDNVNAGVTSFNSHIGPGVEDNEPTDLSIVGKQSGLAPAAREYAACVNAETYQGEAYKYALKGFAWNTNIGFVSYSCKNGFNLAGGGVGIPCGNIDYGVYINDKNELFGHAWSPSFGWLQFKGTGGEGGISGPHSLSKGNSMKVGTHTVEYKEKVAWGNFVVYYIAVDSEFAGIYVTSSESGVDFPQSKEYSNGVKLTLLSELITFNLEVPSKVFNYGVTMLPADGTLRGHAWTEAGVYMQMLGARIILPDLKDEPLVEGAWCEDKPWICVEVTPNPVTLKFDTKDDVMIADGVDGYEVHLYLRDENGGPLTIDDNVSTFLAGVKINYKDTVKTDSVSPGAKVNNALAEETSPWGKGSGAVVYKPLKFSDFKLVAGDAGHYVSKEKIRSYAPTAESNISLTTSIKPAYQFYNDNFLGNVGVNVAEKNELLIKSITYPELKNASGETLLAPGAVYANGKKTDLPLKFRPAVEVNPLYVGLAQDKFVGYRSVPENIKVGAKVIGGLSSDITDAAKVVAKLAYDKTQTCQNASLVCNFIFKFIAPDKAEISALVSTLKGAGLDLQVLALLPEFDEDNPGGYATFVKSPTLYTEVSYEVEGKKIAYYSNKIPRVPGDKIVSPSLVVHGSIQGQLTASVGASGAVDTSGQVNVNLIRDTINENLKKYVTSSNLSGTTCTITGLDKVDGGSFKGATNCKSYAVFKTGNENVIYFKGANVTLNLSGGTWQNEWIVISDGGNIFIDGDSYVPDVKAGAKLSIVSLRASGKDYFSTGHVYIAPDVKNFQGTIVADGSVFSYDGNHASIDAENGEPIWATPFDRAEKLGKQLWIQGAIYSDNTIGGADLDKASNDQSVKPKTYLLLGGGDTVKPDSIENRVRAQSYDLNYLRMFALDLQIAASGLPIDQKCGKALSADDIMAIANKETVYGEKGTIACNGINPLKRYSTSMGTDAGPDGDLIVPTDSSILAEGLNHEKDFDPVYVYFVAPAKNSFLFSKAGALNISGN